MLTSYRSVLTLAVLACAFSTTTVVAEVLTVQVSGTVEDFYDSHNALDGQVQVGQAVTGVYSYDTAAVDQDSYPEYGHYPQDATTVSMSFEIGSLTFASSTTPQPGGMYVVDVANGSWGDGFHVGSMMHNLPLPNGSSVENIDVDLYDPSGTAFSSDALPAQLPELASFEERNIFVYGNGANGYYHIRVRIDSQQLADGETLPPGTFQIAAQINNVYDPGNVFGGTLQPGTEMTGSYRLDLDVADSDPSPEIGHYEHPPSPGYGFALSAGGYSFQSGSAIEPVIVDVIDGPWDDSFHVMTNSGTVEPGGMNAYNIDMHLHDASATAFSSDALSADAPDLARFTDFRELYIGGSDASGNYWSIQAQVVSITAAPPAEPAAPVVVTPASGFFVRPQLVEVAFLMPVGRYSMSIDGSINGQPVPSWFINNCWEMTLWSSGREVALCSDIHSLLNEGVNDVSWTIELDDGTSVTESVRWQVFE